MLTIAIIAGVVILIVMTKHRRRRPAQRTRTRTVSARNQTQKVPQVDPEKERLKVCRDYNRRIKAELERKQAQEDIYHLEQRKRDLLKAYEQLPETDTEKTIRKRIAYDNAIRSTEKQIERAYMILHRTY